MNNEPLSDAEAFHHCLFYFVEALRAMSLDAEAQCEAMGNFNVAWEIQHDVSEPGTALKSWPGPYLSQGQKDEMARLVATANELPPAALSSSNEDAMKHEGWARLRADASRLIELLDSPIRNTNEFLRK